MNHIFISYSRKDKDVVFKAVELLRAEGINVWQDVSGAGTGIPFSTKWFDVITEAMHLAAGAVIFHSENWEASGPCQKEYELIMQCCIPAIVMKTEETRADFDAAVKDICVFLKKQVYTEYNEARTKLISSAYEYREGANPYTLIPKTRGVTGFADYILFELRAMRIEARDDDFKKRNPELYPYIKKYLRFARAVTGARIGAAVLTALSAAAAVLMLLTVPKAFKEISETNRQAFTGFAEAANIAQNAEADPMKAIGLAQNVDESLLKSNSYLALYQSGQQLLNMRLPDKIAAEGDPLLERIASAETQTESPLFTVEFPENAGGIIVTDQNTGLRRTVRTPGRPQMYAWSADGETLLYAVGTAVFAYDAVGGGEPVRLSECYGALERVLFTEADGVRCAAAVAKDGYAVLWQLPQQKRPVRRSGVTYGVFTGANKPEAVFISGNEIVIALETGERAITPELKGTLRNTGFDVSPDGERIALLCENGDAVRIVCVSLKTGEIVTDVQPAHMPTALAFSADGSEIFASARECAILKVNAATGEIEYGSFDALYFQNIVRYGDKWALTDYEGYCTLFDSSLQKVRDCGFVNSVFVPHFDLAVDETNGFLYTVNRGGASGTGCTRFGIEDGSVHYFVIREMQGVDSNTAAAVSGDGRYVAFGYPNGTVRVHEQAQMYLAFEFSGLGEAVSALRFSDDGSELYVLGATGNLRRVELRQHDLWTGAETMAANWQRLADALTEKKNRYIEGLPEGE